MSVGLFGVMLIPLIVGSGAASESLDNARRECLIAP